jgi:SAM-dependent methyltransferase
MADQQLHAAWTSGDSYEAWMGRWSRPIARQYVPWLRVPQGSSWLDVGCGTGILTAAILRDAAPGRVMGVDRSEAYIAEAGRRLSDERVVFDAGDAQALPYGSQTFDAVVSGLLLNFLPDPEAAVRDMMRVARPGGTVSGYVWDYLDGMEIMRFFWEVAAQDDPTVIELPEVRRYPLCHPEPLRTLFAAAGLDAIEVVGLESPAAFTDFDDYWQPFLGGQGTAPTYVASLPEGRRTALREKLRAALPISADGRVPLRIRAWAVRGVRAPR